MTESSKGERGYTGEDVELLMEHVHRQQTSLADRFITMAAPEDNLSLKRSAEDAELDNKASDGKEDSKQPARKRAKSSTRTRRAKVLAVDERCHGKVGEAAPSGADGNYSC